MPPSREFGWAEIENVLDQALEAPPPERAAVVAEACAGNADLESRVRELLDAGLVVDTIEVGATWDRIGEVYERVVASLREVPSLRAATAAHHHLVPIRIRMRTDRDVAERRLDVAREGVAGLVVVVVGVEEGKVELRHVGPSAAPR